nr:putative arginine/ornithine antiporter [Candidatus Pantoea persica]
MEKKLGLSALTALVLSSMLGVGVFSLPQDMAAVAGPAVLLIGWVITGVGIVFLALVMLLLTRLKPELDGGIFTYARAGFGKLVGFCSAWGCWLCAVIANVSYLVIVFSALSFFTDSPGHVVLPGRRCSVHRCCCGWCISSCCAASINLLATLDKLVPLLPLLSLGIVPCAELAQMRNPSIAGLMTRLMDHWGDAVIAGGLIVSVCGAYLSWTIMAAEELYRRAAARLRCNCGSPTAACRSA